MFNRQFDDPVDIVEPDTRSDSQAQDQDTHRGLALLVLITVAVTGASWLLSTPVYFDLRIAAQILPALFSIVLLFLVSRINHPYLNLIAVPLGYLAVFASWAYVIYLNSVISDNVGTDIDIVATELHGMSSSMYILGLCFISLWQGRYFKYALILSSLSIISFLVLLVVFSSLSIGFLLATLLLLASSVAIGHIGFASINRQPAITANSQQAPFFDNDLLLPAAEESSPTEAELEAELEINTLPLNESSPGYDWELILRELNGELKNTADVDQLFKRMLVFLHGAMEFDGAAVGMLQDKAIKKIAGYGNDEYLDPQILNWTSQRIKNIFSSSDAILSKQTGLAIGADAQESLQRIDVPVLSGQKTVGLVTLFRKDQVFDKNEAKLASSIVFHSMVALRQARLQEEVKRLSSDTTPARLTLYSREQFVSKVKPVFAKLNKPRECSLFIVEIDNLDFITDTEGRDVGQLLYKTVSRAIMSQLREMDILGRYGKEGFIVLLDETDLMHARSVAEKVLKKIAAIRLKHQDKVITTTASIGLTIVSDAEEDLASLMRKADMGLFVARENGSNTIKVSL